MVQKLKFIVETNKNGEIITNKYKSLKEIHQTYPQLEYFQIRTLYNYSKTPTNLHPFLKNVSQKIKIYDIDNDIDI